MRKLIFVAFAALTLTTGACKKNKFEKALSEESDWKDKICACTDKACTDKTWKDYKEAEKAQKDDFDESDLKDLSGDIIEKSEKIEKELRECHKKFDKE